MNSYLNNFKLYAHRLVKTPAQIFKEYIKRIFACDYKQNF